MTARIIAYLINCFDDEKLAIFETLLSDANNYKKTGI